MGEMDEYKDLYIQTARDYIKGLNDALLALEKNPADHAMIEQIFINAHSLKGQSAAMEYKVTGFLCHVVEDVFYEIKHGRMQLTPPVADELFAAFDGLKSSLDRIEHENQEVDLQPLADKLKALTGVQTEGMGKSERSGAAPAEQPAGQQPPPSPPPASEPQKKPAPPPAPAANQPAVTTIAVKVDVLDAMMNSLENLLVERLKFKRISRRLQEDHPDLKDYFNASEKILADLQYQIMKARAVPVRLVFDHFPRAVRDLGRIENKEVELVMTGGDLELDRTIIDRLDEPLIHLLRNAVSHGIKDKGTITLSAEHQKDYALIRVVDTGQGIDWEQVAQKAGLPAGQRSPKALKDALFSGISTSQNVTEISGRGVGLLAIKKMVDNFGGSIDVVSEPGQGTAFNIRLPLTLAIAKALIVRVNRRHFAIPTLTVERIVDLPISVVKKVAGTEAFVLEETDVPLLRLDVKLAAAQDKQPADKKPAAAHLLAVIVGEEDHRLGLVVDAVIDTSDIVIKPLPDMLKGTAGLSGVTILSDGNTALIINPQELL
jgi:two-component system, chemotaxis family, sensor kinase CheA